jgi:hypothetical protein
MAVVNIASGTASSTTNTEAVLYTVPSGRSARVEIHMAPNGNGSNNQVRMNVGNVQLYQYRDMPAGQNSSPDFGGTWGRHQVYKIGGSNDTLKSSDDQNTLYVPSGTSINLYHCSAFYVAIEEDDA